MQRQRKQSDFVINTSIYNHESVLSDLQITKGTRTGQQKRAMIARSKLLQVHVVNLRPAAEDTPFIP